MTLDKNTLLHNRYRIVDILGQGGMGSVYRAIDENLGVPVALKENLFTTEEYTRQFRLEAVILANLRHPNMPRVSDHFELGDQGQYLVMDFIEGEDLRYRMERLGTISEDDAVQIGGAICDALSYLHSRKPSILHRDIKPGNVKITPDGHIFLVDFGLAKVYQGNNQATTTGARAMTPGYSPPEQYGTARTDPRTDIYSLGATLYAAITGIIPEDGLARAMDNAQLTPLRKRNPKVTRKFALAIEKAMAVDPSDRFQTAEEFKKALLGSKSKTQQIGGGYAVEPPPPGTLSTGDPSDSMPVTVVDKEKTPPRAPGSIPPPFLHTDDQPFVSPLKKQKERERKRRNALIRFVILLLVLAGAGVFFFVPDLLPANLRAVIPMIAPVNTSTPTVTASPLPTATSTVTETPSPLPTSTAMASKTPIPPTKTPASTATATVLVESTSTASPAPTATNTPGVTVAPAVTPVGGGAGQIAYVSSRSGLPQIYLLNMANQELKQLTDIQEGACQPAWSPDGKQLVFISPCKGMDEIYYDASLYLINADGSGFTPIVTVPGGDFDPKWSPDGKSIAFTSLRTGQMELFVLNVADQTVTQITKGASTVESRQAAWSPDGTQIVYVVKRFGVYQIWLMNSDGTNPKQIVRSGTRLTDYLPTWSLDGQLILFNQRCAVTFCFPYLMRISATDRTVEQGTPVQLNALSIEDVDYSPDGFWLVYEGEEADENRDIYYMTVTGANRTRLTTDKGLDFDPAWRPLAK